MLGGHGSRACRSLGPGPGGSSGTAGDPSALPSCFLQSSVIQLSLPPAPTTLGPRTGPHVEGFLQQIHDVGRVLLQHPQRRDREIR